MAVDDIVESEVALAVAATAALFSPPVRALVRRGAVAGVAGVLMASDLLRAGLNMVGYGVEVARSRAASGLEDITEQPPEEASPRSPDG